MIDELTLPDVHELYSYWERHPPLHELVAHFVGFKPPPKKKAGQKTLTPDFKDFYRAMTGSNLPV
jgi:hypothetical protein